MKRKMRTVVEAMVDALLTQMPKDIDRFCLEWLVQWNKDNEPGREEIPGLAVERDALLERRDRLLKEMAVMRNQSRSGSIAGSNQGSRVGSHRDSFRRDYGSDEAGIISEAEEASEREKIRRMKDKDRRAGVSAEKVTEERLQNWKRPLYEKIPEVRERLRKTIDENDKLQVLFGGLRVEDVYGVIDAMFPKEVATGTNVITQGEEGDNMYIIDEGAFDVFVQRGGDGLPCKVCDYGPGAMFGELALMYNAQRAATVTATSNATLYALDRDSFQMMLTTTEATKMKQYENFLASVEILQDLTKYEIVKLSDMLTSELFEEDEVIIQQGTEGNYFYILEDGEAKAYIGGQSGEIEVKHYNRPGEYFGEIALLLSATRNATVRASGGGCTVLSVSRLDFDAVLGPIKDILGKHIDKYPQYETSIREERERAEQEASEAEKIARMKDGDRRQGVSAPAMSEERIAAWQKPSHPKTQDVKDRIKKIIDTSDKLQVLFGHLAEKSLYDVIDAMFPSEVAPGENVIIQGAAGDRFYIVDDGSFDVFVQRDSLAPRKVCDYGPGAMFGELALMYNAPRAATVTATSASKLWALDRESFQMMLVTAENTKMAQYEGFLENIDLFKSLTRYEISQLSDMLESELFAGGEDICKQMDEGNYFYIIEDGEAKAYITGEEGEVEVKHYNKPGDYFGEVALITRTTRRATVRAVGEGCSVLSVSRDDFDRVLGPIKDVLAENIGNYPAYAEVIQEAIERYWGRSGTP